MSNKILKTIWLALVGLAFLVSCTQQKEAEIQPVLLQGKTMGTTFHIKFFSNSEQLNQNNLYQAVVDELARINSLMSTYDPNSELSKINQSKAGELNVLSEDNQIVLKEALRISELSGGAFDVTVGPLVNLWGFGPDGRITKQPSQKDVDSIGTVVGNDKFALTSNTLVKHQDKTYIDFSSIAKGYAVDQLAELLEAEQISNYLVEVGGEMRLSGKKPSGQAWTVAVEKPVVNRREAQLIFSPGNMGMATSGDYRNYFEQDGQRFSHTIDPNTAKPIDHKLASVTVLHESAMTADALATAINVMGPVKGIELAEEKQLAVYLLIKTDDGFAEVLSTEFRKVLEKAESL